MPQQLTRRKCERILRFYKKPVILGAPLVTLRAQTKHILHDKMCKCVNALYKGNATSKSRDLHAYEDSIAICKRSVYGRKGLTPPRFTCRVRR
jgi:hypothetical protein